jgi:hypothetical protein
MSNTNDEAYCTSGGQNEMTVDNTTTPPVAFPMAGFDFSSIMKTVSEITKKVTSDLKPTDDGPPPEIGQVFASLSKVLAEPESNKSLDGIRNSLKSGYGIDNIGDVGNMFGNMFSAAQKNPPPVNATHQVEQIADSAAPPPLIPRGEKTVVLEVKESEVESEATKKFTIDVSETATPDIFALELKLEKEKFFYKFLLKERHLNLSIILDVVK